jgi:hypothetical protein
LQRFSKKRKLPARVALGPRAHRKDENIVAIAMHTDLRPVRLGDHGPEKPYDLDEMVTKSDAQRVGHAVRIRAIGRGVFGPPVPR